MSFPTNPSILDFSIQRLAHFLVLLVLLQLTLAAPVLAHGDTQPDKETILGGYSGEHLAKASKTMGETCCGNLPQRRGDRLSSGEWQRVLLTQ